MSAIVKELKRQLISALLVILTAAAVISAGINFQQQKKFRLPDDGVLWVDRGDQAARSNVQALHIVSDSAADRAGLRNGDILKQINGMPVEDALAVTHITVRLGAWNRAEYVLERGGLPLKATLILRERLPDTAMYYQYVLGLAYLAIGIFVYFRRGSAPKARHFYILCLASFVLSAFHYTGKLNNFDKVIYWGNVIAGVLAPAIFLHFCLAFSERRRLGARTVLLYLPAAAMVGLYVGLASGTLRVAIPLIELRWLADRLWLVLLTGTYLAGAVALAMEHRRTEDGVLRQQLKWLRSGALLGVVPFTALYAVPYLLGVVPSASMNMAVLSLLLIPLTWAYAILRYRLMDVDVIFQQGYAYTLATLAVLGIFYGIILSIGQFEELSPSAVVLLILIATFVFQPIRNWIQEQLDRYYFYKDRYDYRRTLIEFARELGAETDLDAMLHAVADRLLRTLGLQEVAFFVHQESAGGFRLRWMAGRDRRAPAQEPDLSFLSAMPEPERPYLFFERTRHPLDVVSQDWPASVRQTIAGLGFTYYVPCPVRGRTIAWLGVSRTTKGDFLSSEDLELLMTLCGSVGIAIENARLYHSLQGKVEQYERLKEFSENIVESINVGILAADLDDRVESWNSQIERLTGITRERALGRRLGELFARPLVEEFDKVRGESGIHHVYKIPLGAGGNGYEIPGERGAPEVVVHLAIAPLVARNQQQIGRLVIFDDITERDELERRLVQADKMSSIGLLAAGVAHEVNTPLAVISTYAQMLAKQVGGDEQKSRMLDKIAKQTFRASEIVNSLLSFSRTSPTDFDEVDLNRVARETLGLIEPQLRKAGIEVRQELDEALPAVRANFGKMQQVFLNLFLNARDAMETGGVLALRTWSDNGSARVEIGDTGKGIPAEDLPRIYDPFFTTKAGRKGTGLGLSVTYGIVREHGGVIEVETRPGQGTRFQLEFPVIRKPVNA